MIRTIAMVVALTTAATVAHAQSSAFTADSLGELRRVFGTTPRPPAASVAEQRTHDLFAFHALMLVPDQSAVQTLIGLNSGNTPHTIDSLALLPLLDRPTSDPVFMLLWHQIALDATAIDFSVIPGGSPRYQEQPGPPRTSLALAAIHLAMFEAANVFDRRYASYLGTDDLVPVANTGTARDAAIVEAAYMTMMKFYPNLKDRLSADANPLPSLNCQSGFFNRDRLSLSAYHQCSIEKLGAAKPDTMNGQMIGKTIFKRVMDKRNGDHSDEPEPTFDKDNVVAIDPNDPTRWSIDPVSGVNTELGGRWGDVTPFAAGVGPALYPTKMPQITHAPTDPKNLSTLPSFELVRDYGVESRFSPGTKPANHDGLFVAQFWAYDGTANLCAPPRLYNQIALAALGHVETNRGDATATALDPANTVDVARYFALTNIAMSDAAVAAWGAKYKFQFARPITYIRAAADQALPASVAPTHPLWLPIGAQTTNAAQPFNVTPPFPSYPSGHAVFGGAMFGIMRQFIKPAAVFTIRSDEFNGHNRDAFNYVRCNSDSMNADTTTPSPFCAERKLTLDCAERENADSRVFMGVHWLFDADDGITLGNRVAKEDYGLLQRNGTPDTPTSYSTMPGNPATMRAGLLCENVRYPLGWQKIFGDLTVVPVN